MHPIAGVHLDLAVVAQDRDRDDDLLLRDAQDLVQPGLEVEPLGGVVEARHHRLERILLREEAVLLGPDDGSDRGAD